ncbi:MAG: DUF3253 domain-containing protein [Akkermansiaceae bacterium]|nr:DUF3253 domain-containing protein [Akkermansiaceae bacterium]
MIPNKICRTCGRAIQWRKKWETCWHEIHYCSTQCRRSKPNALDQELEKAILKILTQRANYDTICPSEATRTVFKEEEWQKQMERTRQAARRLHADGKIEILQKGKVVDPSTFKGTIQLRKRTT